MKTDTIAAITTAMSNAGIGKIRISGEEAFKIIDRIYQSKNKTKVLSKQKSHTIHYGYIIDKDVILDEVIVLLMRAPYSYTKEDIVEIDCHGGVLVLQKILEILIKNGARCAQPGEFTKRAFLNGRIDLSQAEAVIDLIQAKNEYALDSSIKQLRGNLKEKIKEIREIIISDIAFIEASLDDPEHYNVDGFGGELNLHVDNIINELNVLLQSIDNGRILKEGINTVILGKPNVGKSSLLNILLNEERAIVTDIPGTTRDILEEAILINGISLNIIDTAGIRKTNDIVEEIGVKKAVKIANDADLILYVVDGSVELDENDEEIMKMIENKKVIILLNKVDIDLKITKEDLQKKSKNPIISISTKEKIGIKEFETCIKELFFQSEIKMNDEIIITNIRHKEALLNTVYSLNNVKESIDNQMPEDFYSIDLMNAYELLGNIIGEAVEEDLINKIFSEFCMGK